MNWSDIFNIHYNRYYSYVYILETIAFNALESLKLIKLLKKTIIKFYICKSLPIK